MKYWIEVRAWTERVGRPFFVALDELPHTQYLGFRSVYAYSTETRDKIIAAAGTAGLEDEAVYSDTLFVDFDNADEAARQFLLFLYDSGVQHTAWHSGNRSTHVHVPIVPMLGSAVPWSQRKWIEENAPQADVTFYHQAGQYRLPGTMHKLTGRRKVLVRELGGAVLEIPMRDRSSPTLQALTGVTAEAALMAHLLRRKGEGSRRVWVWHLAKLARDSGLSLEHALAKIQWWNTRYCTPRLDSEVVRQKVFEVYKG